MPMLLPLLFAAATQGIAPLQVGGIYPHLAVHNRGNECGIGAVVPWASKLWVVTYAPHQPGGSDDRLYSITDELELEEFRGSVGGTPANRMIHPETRQLLIGPYVIDFEGKVRVIAPERMYGRLTGNARHLTEPDSKVYYATMEEGLYEVELDTLDVKVLIRDGNEKAPKGGATSALAGYHGKGLYSGQGRVIYANNGEHGKAAKEDPTTSSGALASWSEEGKAWSLVRRNQFTEVTGPGGIHGAAVPDEDPVWTLGWDTRSLLLGLMESGEWSYFRLPKASHSYDGAHGWNTEWPRIREIGEGDRFLATMHGTFWAFPRAFSLGQTGGIRPRSNYLKVVGDFCRDGDSVVLGCDDSAKAEFLNKRPFKSKQASPLESNSNLWFLDPARLDQLGPVIGRGSVWLREDVPALAVSDPYLFAGYDHRQLAVVHGNDETLELILEVDMLGDGNWSRLKALTVEPGRPAFHAFGTEDDGEWIRIQAPAGARGITAHFQYRNRDTRGVESAEIFRGLAPAGADEPAQREFQRGLMRSLRHDRLGLIMYEANGEESGYYELGPDLVPRPVEDSEEALRAVRAAAQPRGVYTVDESSVLLVEDGERYRLPVVTDFAREGAHGSGPGSGPVARVCREVATERDLLNIGGTVYELPARNASGMRKVRAIATHGLAIHDFCSHAGLLLLTGVQPEAASERIFRSSDGRAAVWAGVVDELWQLGKPRGTGGPWKQTPVEAGAVSDRYLMAGYDKKSARLVADAPTRLTLEVDVDGTDLWIPFGSYELSPQAPLDVVFPEGFSAYWVRARVSASARVSVTLRYQ